MTNADTTTMMMMTDQEKIAIASAKIVYVLAISGCGKSFTGDYLDLMHGFHHVDGGKLLYI
jgi:ABC-type nitrate/sulfonate/bicarbonate transport system ATPase subunit